MTDVESYYQNLSLESKNKLFRYVLKQGDKDFSKLPSRMKCHTPDLGRKISGKNVCLSL